MTVFTIGFTKKSAEQFFETLVKNDVQLLVDVRLNNRSQLAGFTKDGDIQYFLRRLGNIRYIHYVAFAPTKDLLTRYQKKDISWEHYVGIFTEIMKKRDACRRFLSEFEKEERICLLCSEPTPEHCHRRLVAEMIAESSEQTIEIKHL